MAHKSILFDLDGTLTDSGEGIMNCAKLALEHYGLPIPSEAEMPGYSAEWTFTFKYGQADSVTVVVDPSNTVSRTEMEEFVEAYTDSAFIPITKQQISALFSV